jgi:hypothetical protein
MKRLLASSAFAFTFALAFATAAHADRSINDSGVKIDHDCATDPEVSINGSSVELTLTGACTKLAINGSSCTVTVASASKVAVNGSTNTVAIDAADKIAITGSNNTVTYKRGVTKKKPKISKLGSKNSVKRIQ